MTLEQYFGESYRYIWSDNWCLDDDRVWFIAGAINILFCLDLNKKETIVENQSYFYSPCYVIKGLYDKETHLFLDELNKERFLYSDINIIGGDSTYCVGEIYTEEVCKGIKKYTK